MDKVSDLISRQAVEDLIMETDPWWCEGMMRAILEGINQLPPIDPVKHAKWTYDDESNTGIYAICSACGESVYQAGEWLYCPRCGAKMEDSEE